MPDTISIPDDFVAEFLDLARSANISFDLVDNRLHMRMVNPDWTMWRPIRHLLDEIGLDRIEAFVRRDFVEKVVLDQWATASADRLYRAAEAMRG